MLGPPVHGCQLSTCCRRHCGLTPVSRVSLPQDSASPALREGSRAQTQPHRNRRLSGAVSSASNTADTGGGPKWGLAVLAPIIYVIPGGVPEHASYSFVEEVLTTIGNGPSS